MPGRSVRLCTRHASDNRSTAPAADSFQRLIMSLPCRRHYSAIRPSICLSVPCHSSEKTVNSGPCLRGHGLQASTNRWPSTKPCRAFNCRILYGLYLPTVILTIIWCPPTHSFTPGLKPSFSANSSHCSPSFLLLKYSLHGFPGLFTVTSEHICFLLLVCLFLHFLVVSCVR